MAVDVVEAVGEGGLGTAAGVGLGGTAEGKPGQGRAGQEVVEAVGEG